MYYHPRLGTGDLPFSIGKGSVEGALSEQGGSKSTKSVLEHERSGGACQ